MSSACAELAAAVASGHASGACCFCSRQLDDPRSVAHGYGPICAGHYGLPWDAARDAARAANVASAFGTTAVAAAGPVQRVGPLVDHPRPTRLVLRPAAPAPTMVRGVDVTPGEDL